MTETRPVRPAFLRLLTSKPTYVLYSYVPSCVQFSGAGVIYPAGDFRPATCGRRARPETCTGGELSLSLPHRRERREIWPM